MKSAVAVRHIHFEDLGVLEPLLRKRGYEVRYLDAGVDDLAGVDPASPDLIVILGAPIDAGDEETYPFLVDEIRLVRQRLDLQWPLLGVCLGAQLIARALGAKVQPMGVKAIGFSPLTLTEEGKASPLAALGTVPVLHWHGDQFARRKSAGIYQRLRQPGVRYRAGSALSAVSPRGRSGQDRTLAAGSCVRAGPGGRRSEGDPPAGAGFRPGALSRGARGHRRVGCKLIHYRPALGGVSSRSQLRTSSATRWHAGIVGPTTSPIVRGEFRARTPLVPLTTSEPVVTKWPSAMFCGSPCVSEVYNFRDNRKSIVGVFRHRVVLGHVMASDAQKDGPISSAGVIRVNRIEIFPVKSLDGVLLEEATITAGGILENDRVYAIVDEDGAFVNGKRTARVHDLRCAFAKSLKEISVWESGQSSSLTFSLEDREPLGRWLSDFIGFRVSVKYEPRSGFPDDSAAYGPTVVSDASLREVQTWYASLSRDNVRRRFRSNIELEGGEAFCEDALFGAPGELKPFRLGAVRFLGHNPCQRCVVPTRDPETGEVIHGFQKSFAQLRQRHLSPWADARRFNHFYRFALNTSIPPAEAGKRLRVGDPLMA